MKSKEKTKDFKTINRIPDINVYPIEKMNYHIFGKILYMTSCVKNITFIITDEDYFYVIENGKDNGINKYPLVINDKNEKDKDKKDKIKYQTKEQEFQIWCHKLGSHAIIKYKTDTFYYNSNLGGEKVVPLILNYEDQILQPYAVAFDDDFLEQYDTGEILFSDYYSDIYKLQIKTNNQSIRKEFKRIFSFRGNKCGEIVQNFGYSKLTPMNASYSNKNQEKFQNEENEEDSDDFNFFRMDKNDRIYDMKLISSSKLSMHKASKGNEGKNIFILAITNTILFQFQGKDSFEKVFENYSIKNGDILKGYKKFWGSNRFGNFKLSRIQLINQYLESSKDEEKKEKRGILFGFMSKVGYCIGKLKNLLDSEPQRAFTVFEYINPKQKQIGNELIPNIKVVCQSINHIFFLYKDCLVILNKLTNRIIHVKFLEEQFLDMYYDQVLNGIILYTQKDIYKIPLEQEHRYLWIDYIEIGNYELALKTLTLEDKHMRPKLHKLYAEYLFKEKKYLESATEYAFSDEIFEQVCLKFLSVNNNKSLIRYLALINYFRISGKKDILSSKEIKFIEKYLINTWLLELIIANHENDLKGGINSLIKSFMRDLKHGNDFVDIRLLYFILSVYGRDDELIEFAGFKQDYSKIILCLINHKEYLEALKYIKENISYGIEKVNIVFKKIFYNYAILFMKQNPEETIDLLDNYFKINKTPEDTIRILMSADIQNIIDNEDEFKKLINYIKKLMNRPIKLDDVEINFTKNKNLHNLYILLLSYSQKKEYQKELIDYLKSCMDSYYYKPEVHFDLYFAKKIFNENPIALSLIYFLSGQFDESIEIALKNDLKDLSKLIAQNINEPKLKNQIWIKIFKFRKKEGFLEAKKIVNESNGFIKIEEILPLMGDNVKINEFKDELKDCIKTYEKNVDLLKKEINEFNISSNLIQKDISKAQKKAMSISFNQIRCHQCGKIIKDNKFYMFPCKHIFDSKCLIDTYIKFNKQGMGDDLFKQKVKAILNLVDKIKNLRDKKIKASSGETESSRRLPHIRALLKLDNTQKEQFSEEEESQLDLFNKGLCDFLDEECLLCGKEIIKGTQVPFGDQNSLEWEVL